MQVDAWIDYTTGEVDAPLLSWFLPLAGIWPHSAEKEAAAKEALKKGLAVLDAHLATRTFLVGDAVTLADIVAACNVFLGYTKLFDATYRKSVPHVTRWYETVSNQPHAKAVLGDAPLCAKTMTFDPATAAAAKEALLGKGAPAAGAPAAPAAGADAAAAPKPKNPLDLLPPSPMALDSWKRLYSNTPAAKFREVCIAGLWKGAAVPNSPTNEVFPGFDPAGFSLWFCDYKYPEENTVNYVVMNKVSGERGRERAWAFWRGRVFFGFMFRPPTPPLHPFQVGGFLQRIDYARKYAFGAMCILKDDKGQFPIRGAWIFRGQAIPPQMVEECYDLDLYNWVKVDAADEKARARIENMFAEEATIDGLEHIECKIFK